MPPVPARTARAGAVAPPPLTSLARGATALLGQLGPVAHEALVLADELGKVLTGSSELAPDGAATGPPSSSAGKPRSR